MKKEIYTFFRIFLEIFSKENHIFFLAIILGTILIVLSGFDWYYLILVNNYIPREILFISDVLGYFLPTILILFLFIYSLRKPSQTIKKIFLIVLYSTSLSIFTAGIIKALTGRTSPPHHGSYLTWINNSMDFNFGFMREQILGGYPSTHTTIFFALAFSLLFLFPNFKKLHIFSFILTCFIGLGVTLGFHWFSEFFAGSILGFIISKSIYKELK